MAGRRLILLIRLLAPASSVRTGKASLFNQSGRSDGEGYCGAFSKESDEMSQAIIEIEKRLRNAYSFPPTSTRSCEKIDSVPFGVIAEKAGIHFFIASGN